MNKSLPFLHFILISVLFLGIVSAIAWVRGFQIATEGIPKSIATTSKRLWSSGSFESKRYYEIHNNLHEEAKKTGKSFWQDLYSLSVDGKLYPMHSPLLSIIAAPFFGIFGEAGFLIVNWICVLLLLCSLYRLSRTLCEEQPSLLLIPLIFLGTPLIFYTYELNYDLMGTAFIICGLDLLTCSPILGSFLISSSVFIRPSYVLFLPVLLFSFYFYSPKKAMRDCFLGALAPIGIFLVLNKLLWGSLFITINQRMPYYTPQGIGIYNPKLTVEIFLARWPEKLFSTESGFLLYSPALLLLPLALWIKKNSRFSHFFTLSLLVAAANFAVIFSFHCWMCTRNGSRFLLPVTFLLLLPITSLLKSRKTETE